MPAGLKEAMGEWLGQLDPWDVFTTWTFSRPVRVEGAMYWARRHLRWLEQVAQQPIYAFVGAEDGGTGGLVHLHGLVGNVGHLLPYCGVRLGPGQWGRSCCLLHAWPCGIARVLRYDPTLRAAWYVSKYVTKDLAEWELFGFPARPQMTLDMARGEVHCSVRVGERK